MYSIDPNAFMNTVVAVILGTAALLFVVTVAASWLGGRGRVMSYLYMLTALFGSFGVIVAIMGFRGQTSDARPWHFILDMKYQPKYMSQGESKYFADGRSNRHPPPDTVPFDGTDYAADAGQHGGPNPNFLKADSRYYFGVADADAKATDGSPAKPKWESRKLTGEGYYVNHIPARAVEAAGGWEPLLKRGQVQFDRHCAVCHGAERARRRRRDRLRHRRRVWAERAAGERAHAAGAGPARRPVVQHRCERQRRDARLRSSGEGRTRPVGRGRLCTRVAVRIREPAQVGQASSLFE